MAPAWALQPWEIMPGIMGRKRRAFITIMRHWPTIHTEGEKCLQNNERYLLTNGRLHAATVVSKDVTKQFYGQAHKNSYYYGCSVGGRQGVKAAQAYPEDFDGVLAGAPSVDYNNANSWAGNIVRLTGVLGTGNPGSLSPLLWRTVHEKIMDQCDGLDGVVNGIIGNPDDCNFDPYGMLCAGGNKTGCLTPTQAATVKAAFSPIYAEDGRLMFPAQQVGAEINDSIYLYSGIGYYPVVSLSRLRKGPDTDE
jgi:feruloyl esterase